MKLFNLAALLLALAALCCAERVHDACDEPGWEGFCRLCESELSCTDDAWLSKRCECESDGFNYECTCQFDSLGGAAIAVIIIVTLGVIGCIVACCYCCTCCPGYQSRHPQAVLVPSTSSMPPPGSLALSMAPTYAGAPQGGAAYMQQPYGKTAAV